MLSASKPLQNALPSSGGGVVERRARIVMDRSTEEAVNLVEKRPWDTPVDLTNELLNNDRIDQRESLFLGRLRRLDFLRRGASGSRRCRDIDFGLGFHVVQQPLHFLLLELVL